MFQVAVTSPATADQHNAPPHRQAITIVFARGLIFIFIIPLLKKPRAAFVKLNISLSQPPIFRWDFDWLTSRRFSPQLHRAYNLKMNANRATLRLLITTQKLIRVSQ